MTLNKPKLVQDLDNLFEGTRNPDRTEAESKEYFVQTLATIIDAYVKSAKVNYIGGLTVAGGTVVGTFNHSIT